MKRWIMTFRVEPPSGVMSARNGGSVFFAAYSRILLRWFMVFPGGEERIPEPQMIFVEDEYAKAHPKDLSQGRLPPVSLRGKPKLVQYELAI